MATTKGKKKPKAATKAKATTQESKTAPPKPKKRISVKDETKLVNGLLKDMVEHLEHHKPSMGDLIRLLQFRREMGGGGSKVKEIEVRWVEPSRTEDVSST